MTVSIYVSHVALAWKWHGKIMTMAFGAPAVCHGTAKAWNRKQ